MQEEYIKKMLEEFEYIGLKLKDICDYQYNIQDWALASIESSIDGVRFCEDEEEVNNWISDNPDKKVIDIKFSNVYDYRNEAKRYSCLILYKTIV